MMPPRRYAYRPTVMGTGGCVAAAHPLAAMAAARPEAEAPASQRVGGAQ